MSVEQLLQADEMKVIATLNLADLKQKVESGIMVFSEHFWNTRYMRNTLRYVKFQASKYIGSVTSAVGSVFIPYAR